MNSIHSEIEKQQEISKQRVEDSDTSPNQWKKNVVDDPDAPQFYSERAIYGFSIAFSVLFGSILLAINLKQTGKKAQAWSVVAFGITYTAIQMFVLSSIERNTTGLGFVASMGGALILNHYFWKTYIGKDIKYRTKPIWIPLIVGIVITASILFVYIYADTHTNPADEYCYTGLEKFKQNDFEGAVLDYDKAFELDPASTEAIYMRALSKGNLGNAEGAIDDYTTLLKMVPNDADAYCNRGDERSKLKDYEGALMDYETAIKLDPKKSNYHINLGVLYMNTKKLGAADTAFTRAIEIDPTNGGAFYDRGLVKVELGQNDLACADFKKALALGLKDAEGEIKEYCK
ncbi:MAG: tetratricopeptide repeat protein [Bacteroidetes bacterium]|nr:tetratricopeptide repeat protein [Bacteroidota bacterium]